MDKTKVGVIGLGGIAQLVHLPILSKLDSVEISAVAEINKNRLKTVGDKYPQAKQFVDYREMLHNEDLDAVIISTPTDTHAEIALESLKNKKNILIEKPITRNFNEAKEIVSAAKKFKKVAMVGMNLRFRPDAMLLRSIINSGELGELFYIKCSWLRIKSSPQKWFVDKKLSGGGVIIDLGIVLLDLALWMMGDVKVNSVSVQNFKHRKTDIEDSAVGLIRLESGKIIAFEVSWDLHSDLNSFGMIVHGTEGSSYLNPLRVFKRVESTHIDYTPSKSSNTQNLFRKSYENELKHFIGCLRDNSSIISTCEEALTRMKLVDAIYKSAEEKKEIKL